MAPLESARAESLLAYLLLHREAPQPRGRLAFLPWPRFDDRHDGRTHVLTGPEAITFAEVGEHLGAVAGLPAQYVDVPDEAARDELRRSGMPDWMADGIVGLLEQLRAGANAQATDVVRIRTGRDPRSLAEFLRDNS